MSTATYTLSKGPTNAMRYKLSVIAGKQLEGFSFLARNIDVRVFQMKKRALALTQNIKFEQALCHTLSTLSPSDRQCLPGEWVHKKIRVKAFQHA